MAQQARIVWLAEMTPRLRRPGSEDASSMSSTEPPNVSPFPPPPYVIGFQLDSGRVLQAATAETLLWGQVLLLQLVAVMQATDGAGVVVLIQHATGLVCERVVVVPNPSPEP
jgi:hypothetical protein